MKFGREVYNKLMHPNSSDGIHTADTSASVPSPDVITGMMLLLFDPKYECQNNTKAVPLVFIRVWSLPVLNYGLLSLHFLQAADKVYTPRVAKASGA
ncbi:hypothetical protein OPV22_013090 [Ensete ventricosum]|uniref:Uncharacterized protein n=1 Tax=Ensete ventricosum TaxID=4639 RepID=A0AAV8R031_ENSVE|nr:hypothetical protein OPV22_013090 [Ensete ventricosum]